MSEAAIARLTDASRGLIDALDHGQAEDVETASTQFRRVLDEVRAIGAWRSTPSLVAQVREALQLADAARARVNYLTDLTRRRFDRLCKVAGVSPLPTGYDRNARLRG
jgi:hypothetical protein